MGAPELKCRDTKQSGSSLSAYGSPHGKRRRHRRRFFFLDQIKQIDREYSYDLLKELGERGERGFIFSVIISVKAGVQAGERQREADDAQQRRAGRLRYDMLSQPRRIAVQDESAARRERYADAYSTAQRS